MRRLTVLYDASCGFCVWCRHWLDTQAQLVRLEMLPARSREAARRFPTLVTDGRPEELVVVSDAGEVYRGAKAWVLCLWALRSYREWALRLARPAVLPLARRAFELVSSNRDGFSRWLRLAPERELVAALGDGRNDCEPSGGCRPGVGGPRRSPS